MENKVKLKKGILLKKVKKTYCTAVCINAGYVML